MILKFRAWDKVSNATFEDSTERYRHMPKGMLTNLYHKMKTRNIKNGFGKLPFSLDEFQKWSINSEKFFYLFDTWVNSGYQKRYKPSVDRTNPNIGYEFNNMSWMFWEDNKKKSYLEVALKKQKPIVMVKNGEVVGKFRSIKDAQFFLSMKSNGNISECLAGRRKNVYGYSFVYENPELLESVEE